MRTTYKQRWLSLTILVAAMAGQRCSRRTLRTKSWAGGERYRKG